jgi:hypothetical protein
MATKHKSMMMITAFAGILIGVGFLFNNFAPGLADQPPEAHLYFPLIAKPIHLYFPLVARSISPTVFGVETTSFNSLNGIQTMIQGGATWIHYNQLLWSDLQPDEYTPPNWSSLDALKRKLAALSQEQVNIILVVRNTPPWAQKYAGSACGSISDSKIPAFAQFMHDIVLQLSAPPYNVKYWEIGNEPDAPLRYDYMDYPLSCWGEPGQPYFGGANYAQMLKQVYPAIKLADPEAKVLIGGLLLDCDPDHPIYDSLGQPLDCAPARFLEGIVSSGGGDYFDAVSYHAYDYFSGLGNYSNPNWNASSYSTGPVSIVKDKFVRSVLAKYGYTNKLFINTETALVCTLPECADANSAIRKNFEVTKSDYIAVDYASAIANSLTSRSWYDIDGGWRYTGLLNNKKPLPAYYAFKTAAAELGYASYVQDLSQFPGIKGYQFARGNRVIWFLWSIDGNPHTVPLPREPLQVLDTLGTSITPGQSMTIDIHPQYFEWIGNPYP